MMRLPAPSGNVHSRFFVPFHGRGGYPATKSKQKLRSAIFLQQLLSLRPRKQLVLRVPQPRHTENLPDKASRRG